MKRSIQKARLLDMIHRLADYGFGAHKIGQCLNYGTSSISRVMQANGVTLRPAARRDIIDQLPPELAAMCIEMRQFRAGLYAKTRDSRHLSKKTRLFPREGVSAKHGADILPAIPSLADLLK